MRQFEHRLMAANLTTMAVALDRPGGCTIHKIFTGRIGNGCQELSRKNCRGIICITEGCRSTADHEIAPTVVDAKLMRMGFETPLQIRLEQVWCRASSTASLPIRLFSLNSNETMTA